jgi:azurin
MLWRLTAQRLLVDRGNTDVISDLYNLVKQSPVGNSYDVIHALWTLDGLGALTKDDKAESIVMEALRHPSPGVRKAAIQILSKSGWREETVAKYNLLNEPDPNTRLAVLVSLTGLQPSDSIGSTLYKMSIEPGVIQDEWLSKAVYIAAAHHKKGFIQAFLAANPGYDPNKLQPRDRESLKYNDSTWKTMVLPTFIEQAGLDVDGFIWFRKEIVLSTRSSSKGILSLGPVNDSDQSFINGVKVGGIDNRYLDKRIYEVNAGILKPGKNIIAVRVEDIGGRGGIYGKPEEMYLQSGSQKISLAGEWKYDVANEYSPTRSMFADKSIGETFCETYLGTISGPTDTDVAAMGSTVIHIKAIPHEMKYDLKTFSVQAGKPVELVFENPDFMQHNLLITDIGKLEVVGKAADKMAADPKAADRQYVPDIPEVLFSTKLVNPQETIRLTFTAPSKPGDYPYVCTFPGHWLIMNGVMKVVPPAL